MPYIKSKEDRAILDNIVQMYYDTLSKKGNLNYFLCRLFLAHSEEQGMSYKLARDFLGETEASKMEIYRRWVVPYENKKMKENGDLC